MILFKGGIISSICKGAFHLYKALAAHSRCELLRKRGMEKPLAFPDNKRLICIWRSLLISSLLVNE